MILADHMPEHSKRLLFYLLITAFLIPVIGNAGTANAQTPRPLPLDPSPLGKPVERIEYSNAIPIDSGVVTAGAIAASPTLSATRVASISESESRSSRLRAILEQAKDELDSARIPDRDLAENKLRAALTKLNDFIKPETPNGVAWRKFLRLDELDQQLAARRKSGSILRSIEMNMLQNYDGLEYPQFLAVRSALTEFIQAGIYSANREQTIGLFLRRIDQLLEFTDDSTGWDEHQEDVVQTLSYLHESNQVPDLLRAIRDNFRIPNVQITAKEQFVSDLASRKVARPSPVRECILGTSIYGTACLEGQISIDLLPMAGGVSMCLNLSGRMSSQNRGYNRGVVLTSLGSSPVFASKQIIATPTGVSSLPATAHTRLSTRITSLQHKRRIVTRIAKRQARKQKPLADAIGQSRLQNRIRSEYDSNVSQQLAQLNNKIAEFNQPRPILQRLGIPKPVLAVYSSSDSVSGNVVQAASYQLSAPEHCPIPRPLSAGIVLEAHHSAIVNVLDIVLGNRTIRSADLTDLAKQFLGEVPEEVRIEAEKEDWSVTFEQFRPVRIDFSNDQITLSLRMSNMTSRTGGIKGHSVLEVVYVPEFTNGKVTLVRQGDIVANFAEKGARATSIRSVLRAKFREFFAEEISFDKLNLAETLPNLPALSISSIATRDGWLQVGVK